MVYNVHDVLKKSYSLKYNKIKEYENLIFNDDYFKIIIFQDETLNM